MDLWFEAVLLGTVAIGTASVLISLMLSKLLTRPPPPLPRWLSWLPYRIPDRRALLESIVKAAGNRDRFVPDISMLDRIVSGEVGVSRLKVRDIEFLSALRAEVIDLDKAEEHLNSARARNIAFILSHANFDHTEVSEIAAAIVDALRDEHGAMISKRLAMRLHERNVAGSRSIAPTLAYIGEMVAR